MEKTVSNFYQEDAIAYAAYDNTRKLCGVYDGLKMSQRKLLHTMRKKFPKEFVKTESFANICSAFTQYLHGAANLVGVASGMAQDFVGSNNFPLFKGNSGGFGTRINPVFAAGRYTRMTLAEIAAILFDKRDDAILNEQIFEGEVIEPKTYIPIFPVIFLNGSDGLSTGFSETVFPRNPKEIIAYIKKKLAGTTNPKDLLLPWFRGFKGHVEVNNETGICECIGCIERINTTKYVISEIPIGMEYQKYIEFLDKLCDSGTIVDYEDKCDTKTDNILFEIKTTREFTKKHEDIADLLKVFKLVKTLPENLCFIDQNNKVREYKNIKDVLDDYIDVRYKLYTERKNFLLKTLKSELEKLVSKYLFCKAIIDKSLIISNRSKANIVADLEKMDKIIKIDGTYDYLLHMPLHSVSKETMADLKAEIQAKKDEFMKIKNTSEKDMWIEDLSGFEKFIKQAV